MSLFTSPFFSVAGQKERLANVGSVLNAAFNPFSKNTVKANTPSTKVNKVLETAANHPYLAAGVGAVAANPALAAAAGKEAVVAVGSKAADVSKSIVNYATASPLNAVKTISGAAFVAGGGLTLAPTLYNVTKKATEKAVPILKGDVPFSSDALPSIGDALGSAVGAGLIGAAVGVGAKTAYDYVTSPDSEVTAGLGALPQIESTPAVASDQPITPATTVLGREAGAVAKRRKSAKKIRAGNSQAVRVQVLNQNTYIAGRR